MNIVGLSMANLVKSGGNNGRDTSSVKVVKELTMASLITLVSIRPHFSELLGMGEAL